MVNTNGFVLSEFTASITYPCSTSGLVHFYHLDESICRFRVSLIFSFGEFRIKILISKQCRP